MCFCCCCFVFLFVCFSRVCLDLFHAASLFFPQLVDTFVCVVFVVVVVLFVHLFVCCCCMHVCLDLFLAASLFLLINHS